jgi:hypothetical protein
VTLLASGVALLLVVGAILKLALTTGSPPGGDLRIVETMLVLAGVVRLTPALLRHLGRRAYRPARRGSPPIPGDERQHLTPGHHPADDAPGQDHPSGDGHPTRARHSLPETGAIS